MDSALHEQFQVNGSLKHQVTEMNRAMTASQAETDQRQMNRDHIESQLRHQVNDLSRKIEEIADQADQMTVKYEKLQQRTQ